jgi:hypothetical protein
LKPKHFRKLTGWTYIALAITNKFTSISTEKIAGDSGLSGLIEAIDGEQTAIPLHSALDQTERLSGRCIIDMMEKSEPQGHIDAS